MFCKNVGAKTQSGPTVHKRLACSFIFMRTRLTAREASSILSCGGGHDVNTLGSPVPLAAPNAHIAAATSHTQMNRLIT